MEFNYSDYIYGATSSLVDLLSSNQIRREEKGLYISSFTDCLTRNVFSPEKLEPYEVLFARNSLLFIDDVLTKFISMQPLEREQLDEFVLLCERQKQNLAFLSSENISLPRINIVDIDHFCDEIKINYENNDFINKMLKLDTLITESYKKITSYSDNECDYLFSLLDEMDKNINECKNRGISCNIIKNIDTAKIRDEFNNNRTKLENESYYTQVIALDNRIGRLVDGFKNGDQDPTDKVMPLLEEMNLKLVECKRRGIDTSRLKNTDTTKIIEEINSNRTRQENDSFYNQVITLDNQISRLIDGLERHDLDPTDKVVPLLDEMNLRLIECKRRGIDTSRLKNTDYDEIRHRLDSNAKRIVDNQYLEATSALDKQISDIVDHLSESDGNAVAKALTLLDELDERIHECNNRGISIDKLRNRNTDLTRKSISDFEQEVSDRSRLYDEIISIDNEIVNNCKMWPADPNCITTIVSSCDKCSALLGRYKRRGWLIPKLKCNDPSITKKKYLLYDEIVKTDRIIVDLINDVNKGNHKLLLENVTRQKGLISSCSQNKWTVPELMVKDVDGAIFQFNKTLAKKRVKTKIKVVFTLIILFSVIVAGASIWLRNRYLNTHSRMPINLSVSVGKNYQDIVNELKASGFSSVKALPVSSGIQRSGMVTGITVNGKDSFSQNRFYSKQAEIVVSYSSDDRIDLTSELEAWNKESIDYMFYVLSEKGLVVERNEVNNTDLSSNNMVASIVINGVEYSSGDCFVPEGAKVTINYYGRVCKLENDAKDIIGKDYMLIRAELMSLGFDNIKFVRKDDLITGWINKEGTIAGITINGKDDFKKDDLYFHNAEIIITVHTFSSTNYQYVTN